MPIKKRRVYPAESDPRQANGFRPIGPVCVVPVRRTPGGEALFNGDWNIRSALGNGEASSQLAREFGPWVRGADGRWQRDRRKR